MILKISKNRSINIDTKRIPFAQTPYFSSRESKRNSRGVQELQTRSGLQSGVLDNLVESIKPEFDANKNFTPLFEKYNIQFYRGYSFYPCSIEINNVPYIFNFPHIFQRTEEFSTAHELGHVLLGHLKSADLPREREADRFASKLTGYSILSHWLFMSIESGARFFNPKHRWMIDQFLTNQENYIKWIISNNSPVPYK